MMLGLSSSDFAESFRLLQQEGELFQSCLSTGFTTLRGANPGTKGAYYTAFFQLTIGVERMMKLVFIIDHMAKNDLVPPTSKDLRTLSHDLTTIYAALSGIRSEVPPLLPQSPERQLMEFLTSFAKSTRYYNLDALASGKSTGDPLAEYNQIFTRIVSDDLDRRKLQRISAVAHSMAHALANHVGVVGHGLDGNLISLPNAFMLGPLHEAGTPLLIWKLYTLLAPIRDALEAVTDEARVAGYSRLGGVAAIPAMSEFAVFLRYDRSTVLKKKRWP